MNRPEQLKAQAIDRIWIAKIGEHNYLPDRKYALENDGFILLRRFQETMIGEQISSNDYEQKAFAIEFRKPDVMHIRPIELSGIENNNGWTRIEPDGSNLPTEYGEYECVLKWINTPMRRMFFRCGGSDDAENTKYWLETVSHYRPIEVFKKPIF